MAGPSKQRVIYALKNESELGFVLLMASSANFKEDIISGTIIEQKGRNDKCVIFQGSENTKVSTQKVIERIQVKCAQDGNRYLINIQDYNRMIYDLTKDENQGNRQGSEDDDEGSGDSSCSESNQSEQQDSKSRFDQRRRNSRIKIEENQYNSNFPIESYENDDSGSDRDRGRGRPKGSRNKKTLIKQIIENNQIMMELKMAITGKIKRGKGRPKGSKNKPKQTKMEYRDYIKQEQNQSAPFGKRGKGRPKGSKNKIKTFFNQIQHEEDIHQIEKRGRGRPKGAKNKANSVVSGTIEQQISEEFIKIEYLPVDLKPFESVDCCSRCAQRNLKKKVFYGEIQIEESLNNLKNVTEDYGMENKTNLIILAIKLGDWETLDHLLSVINQTEIYIRPPFNLQKIAEKTKYSVRTKKEVLSKTGKQGIYVLLHDDYQRKQAWWKQVGIERIIENMPKQNHCAMEILTRLVNHDVNLKNEIFSNVVSFIRKGNFLLAENILREILQNPNLNKLNFSQEHYCLLTGNYPVLNQLKKFYIIKHNIGTNFCSPIHCAAMSSNIDFLKKLLTIFTDVVDVEDSQHRKPIHYASVAETFRNMEILLQNGADLKETDRRKMTPLMLACEQGNHQNVEYILHKVRDPYYINFLSDEGYTALHYAILNSQEQCAFALINDPHTDLLKQTRNKEDAFHLLAGTGNTDILELFLKKQVRPIHSSDRFKRTPAMIALRNLNNDFFYSIIQQGSRIDKVDSSQNSLLHYAASYGNLEVIAFLKGQNCQQMKNKKGIYPWEIATLKGHLKCAQLLEQIPAEQQFQFQEDLVSQMLSNIQGTQDYFNCLMYTYEKFGNKQYECPQTGNNYLHLVCLLGEDQYIRRRTSTTNLSPEQAKQQFNFIIEKLIDFFLKKGINGEKENSKKQSPLKMCLENYNLAGFKKLLGQKIDFELESSNGYSALHCISNLACKGLEQIIFVEKKLKNCNLNQLKAFLKKVDHNGFQFLLYFIRNFVKDAAVAFESIFSRLQKKVSKKQPKTIEKEAIDQFVKFQDKFIKLVNYLIQSGSDVNCKVSINKNNSNQKYKDWRIPHFLMKFPSMKLAKYFKGKIKDFNIVNNSNRTPLHEFCLLNKCGHILPTKLTMSEDYQSQNVLKYLLANGLDPNIEDKQKALPILYAAQNLQYQFIFQLAKSGSKINFCTATNKVPLIEIIKKKQYFNCEQIEQLLKLGADPNFTDVDGRTSMHHLIHSSQNFDNSPEICKALLEYKAKINSLDKFQRSPIFYCFTDITTATTETRQSSCSSPNKKDKKELTFQQNSEPQNNAVSTYQSETTNDKVQILQVLLNVKGINLNIADTSKRTLVHYACQKNYFYSILYLLDKNINIEVKDSQENTPLAICLKSENLDQAALIIKKGAQYGFVNDGGTKMSYFSYAIKHLSVGICFMLLDHGYPIQKALEQAPSEVFKKVLIQKYIK